MPHERRSLSHSRRSHAGADSENALGAAFDFLRSSSCTVSEVDGESRSQRATREGKALWRWAKENGSCVNPSGYLELVEGGGQEHRVWYDEAACRYRKVTHAGRYGWTAMMDFRYNKKTQEDEPYVGMERLILQNLAFGDDISLEGLAIEAEGLAIITSQRFIEGDPPQPSEILRVMKALDYERIPGIPANCEDCFSFYHRVEKIAAFDAHTGNYLKAPNGVIISIDLVMVRADQSMHDYLCLRIDAGTNLN
jgi:hypothetical protein